MVVKSLSGRTTWVCRALVRYNDPPPIEAANAGIVGYFDSQQFHDRTIPNCISGSDCTSYGNSIRRLRRFSQTYQEVANSSILSHMRPEEVSPPCSSSNCSDDHESLGCHHCFSLGKKTTRKHGETCWENGFPWEKSAKKRLKAAN